MEPPPNSDKPVPWSRKAIGWIVLCVGLIAAFETSWTSYHMDEIKEAAYPLPHQTFLQLSSFQITLVTFALMGLTLLSLWLINVVAEMESKLYPLLIGVGAFLITAILYATLKGAFREYSAIHIIPYSCGLIVSLSCQNIIWPSRGRKNVSNKEDADPPKQVGWNPPPENNWWSKYN